MFKEKTVLYLLCSSFLLYLMFGGIRGQPNPTNTKPMCELVKKEKTTYLRVVYVGNLRIQGCTACCKRWYFTFNNSECQIPAAIDGTVYQSTNLNIHRSASIEGYCGGLDKGKVQIGFHVGNCAEYGDADAFTSWNSVSRIIIEEVEPPVA